MLKAIKNHKILNKRLFWQSHIIVRRLSIRASYFEFFVKNSRFKSGHKRHQAIPWLSAFERFLPLSHNFLPKSQHFLNSIKLGHVSNRVSNLEASTEFYLRALRPLSFEATHFPTIVGFGPSLKTSSVPIPCIWLRQYNPGPLNNHTEKPTPVHISFYSTNRDDINEFYRLGIEAGVV